jgi:hypothetical protein
MIRQQRRRIERQWSKIKVCEICTDFIELNGLLNLPHIIAFQVVKVSDDLVCIYNSGLFDFKKDRGHGEFVTICMFVSGSLRSMGSIQMGYVPEDSLWIAEEIDV